MASRVTVPAAAGRRGKVMAAWRQWGGSRLDLPSPLGESGCARLLGLQDGRWRKSSGRRGSLQVAVGTWRYECWPLVGRGRLRLEATQDSQDGITGRIRTVSL
jgi:hypothetical protein